MKREYKFLLTTNAPENYASKREVRTIWAGNKMDAAKILLGESSSFGIQSLEFLGEV